VTAGDKSSNVPPAVRALLLGALVALIAACDDNSKVATPTVPPSSTPKDDGGSTDGDGWGDTSTTRREGVLRLGQFNVRRYFDATCDSGKCDGTGIEDLPTQAEYEARTAQLAEGIARLEADVITLAEVENQACLDALQAKLKANGYEYPIAYLAEIGTPGSVDVGILARGTLGTVKNYRKDTVLSAGTIPKFTREFPEIHLKFGDSDVVVFPAHFRSKNDDDPARRIAEAKAAHDIMVATGTANTGAIVLLGGDLNDVPGSETLDAMEKDGALVRVAKDLPVAEQATYSFSGQKEAIDHIFTTASRATAYLPKSAKVVRDGNGGLAGSDHAAIYADFNLP
jgi:endonuclease/exonuclease/phosphatase family metal-dependent hydrolase